MPENISWTSSFTSFTSSITDSSQNTHNLSNSYVSNYNYGLDSSVYSGSSSSSSISMVSCAYSVPTISYSSSIPSYRQEPVSDGGAPEGWYAVQIRSDSLEEDYIPNENDELEFENKFKLYINGRNQIDISYENNENPRTAARTFFEEAIRERFRYLSLNNPWGDSINFFFTKNGLDYDIVISWSHPDGVSVEHSEATSDFQLFISELISLIEYELDFILGASTSLEEEFFNRSSEE